MDAYVARHAGIRTHYHQSLIPSSNRVNATAWMFSSSWNISSPEGFIKMVGYRHSVLWCIRQRGGKSPPYQKSALQSSSHNKYWVFYNVGQGFSLATVCARNRAILKDRPTTALKFLYVNLTPFVRTLPCNCKVVCFSSSPDGATFVQLRQASV